MRRAGRGVRYIQFDNDKKQYNRKNCTLLGLMVIGTSKGYVGIQNLYLIC